MGWFKKALKSAGKVTKVPGKVLTVTAKPINKVGPKLGKVPIVGKGIQAVYSQGVSAPINFAARVSRNPKNVHRATYDSLKQHVKDTVTLAPYAQAVFSMIPGVGTGVSAAIGAGLALSKGQGMTGAMKGAAEGAVPGGPLMRAAYNAAIDIGNGKKLSDVQLDTLSRAGTGDPVKLSADIKMAANGDAAAMVRANDQLAKLPKETRNAVLTGTAIGLAEKYQALHGKGIVESKGKIAQTGKSIISKNPVLMAALRIPEFLPGFPLGIGAMSFKLNEAALSTLGKSLSDGEEIGFYAAIACHIGMTERKPLSSATPVQQLAYFITEGLKGDEDVTMKQSILAILGRIPEAKNASEAVIKHDATQSWWEKVIDWLGL